VLGRRVKDASAPGRGSPPDNSALARQPSNESIAVINEQCPLRRTYPNWLLTLSSCPQSLFPATATRQQARRSVERTSGATISTVPSFVPTTRPAFAAYVRRSAGGVTTGACGHPCGQAHCSQALAPCRTMKRLVGAIGFEPTTPCAQGRCATRLRYAPTPWNEKKGLSDYSRPPTSIRRIAGTPSRFPTFPTISARLVRLHER